MTHLRLGVDARGGLIQHQHRPIEGERPREREQLLLPHRQRCPTLAERRIQPCGQPIDEPVGSHGRGCAPDVGVPEPRLTEADVRRDAAREEVDVLQHEAEERPHVLERELADVGPVHEDASAADVVEPHQQVDDRRLAGARRPDDPEAPPGSTSKRDVTQHVVLGVIGEPHVVEHDVR